MEASQKHFAKKTGSIRPSLSLRSLRMNQVSFPLFAPPASHSFGAPAERSSNDAQPGLTLNTEKATRSASEARYAKKFSASCDSGSSPKSLFGL